VDSRETSFVDNGILHIRPTLTLDVNQPPQTSIPHPVNSARLRTRDAFSFKYGRLEISARLPVGDWLWPALWMLPEHWVFGGWPMSGEIDLMESRGNRDLAVDGNQIGVESVGSTLHFGPRWDQSAWPTAHLLRNYEPGYHLMFHRYGMVWTPEKFEFFVDDELYHTIETGTGFWDRGNFGPTGLENPWIGYGLNAPFDQEFHLLINLAVGGTFFPDAAVNGNGAKPWPGSSGDWKLDFWKGRAQWLDSWNRETDSSHFRVDYVKVWAL
jgi:beta-glucanase (GH16 family)